ncbi:MAG: ornithine carbamoyltransferase [Deltaproteobacteria bacterium]|nr:ornithine carbamoyltransferase [Deltaproteobacteria bacterium]MBI3386800.1 ornithine carbamoyltransferase [Deltaproteobacteria bacterium]
MKRDFLSLADLQRSEIDEILHLSATLKRDLKAGKRPPLLAGQSLAMIFEKPSLRTRVTFEVGMTQLGGYAVYLAPKDAQLGERESVADIARNLERWVDLIMARTFAHDTLIELAGHAGVPVINGLSDLLHPCQVLTDCFTLIEKRGRLDGLRIAFVGDGNNVVNSWINAAAKLGFRFALACPPGYEPNRAVRDAAIAGRADVQITHDVAEAVRGADVIYTDVWTSMGQEADAERRRRDFAGYQVNAAVLALARRDALVMHDLPAHRGEEITDDVIDGPQSIVFDQAENRLHVQKGIMVWLNDKRPKHR